MVELEDKRIGLPAVDTWVRGQMRQHVTVRALPSRTTRSRYLIEMDPAPLTKIRLETFAAPPLVAVLVAVESFEREGPLAPFTSPLHEHMFVDEADGISAESGAGS